MLSEKFKTTILDHIQVFLFGTAIGAAILGNDHVTDEFGPLLLLSSLFGVAVTVVLFLIDDRFALFGLKEQK